MGKLDPIDPNNWNEVISFCKSEGIKPSEVFKLASKKLINKTDPRTISIGILVHDKLELNKRKKTPLKPRSVILGLTKEIRKISGKKLVSDEQVYFNGYKALGRTPGFLLWDKDERKRFGY
mgnify:CR=1 FL=1